MIGKYYSEKRLQEWYEKIALPVAKKMIQQFPSLNEIFTSFNDYEEKDYYYSKNIVLVHLYPSIDGKIRPENLDIIMELEECINDFNVLKWKNKKLEEFINRLTSDNYFVSRSPFTELVIAKYYVNKYGIDNVELFPLLKTGKMSDIYVNIGNKEIFIEVGNLDESLPEQKILNILDQSAEYFGDLITSGYYMIDINTIEFVVNDKGHILVENTVEKIRSEIDRLGFKLLNNFSGTIIIRDFSYAIREREILGHYADRMPINLGDAYELMETSPVKEWIEEYEDEIIKGSELFQAIIGGESEKVNVEFHSNDFFPSKAALAEQASFIRHVKSQITEQSTQLEPNKPNIIVVQGSNWTILFYERVTFLENPLIEELKAFLKESEEDSLSGVCFFSANFENSFFVPNEKVNANSLLTKEDITELGMHFIE